VGDGELKQNQHPLRQDGDYRNGGKVEGGNLSAVACSVAMNSVSQ
jgi:hypothetical protein